MNKITVGNSEIISIFSAFEKLILLNRYNLQKGDVQLLDKLIHLIDAQKLPMVRAVYGAVFQQLDDLEGDD